MGYDATCLSYAGLGASIASDLLTQADILAGTNSGGDKGVTMAWRTRTDAENPGARPLLVSDVLNLGGMVNTGEHQTDLFVLQMTYDDSRFAAGQEATLAAGGKIFLAYLNDSSQWVNAINGNVGPNVGLVQNFQGSWTLAGSPMDLGDWGVDTAGNIVWVVINHNSEFGAENVPEPGTLALLAAGGLWSAAMHRRFLRRRRLKDGS